MSVQVYTARHSMMLVRLIDGGMRYSALCVPCRIKLTWCGDSDGRAAAERAAEQHRCKP